MRTVNEYRRYSTDCTWRHRGGLLRRLRKRFLIMWRRVLQRHPAVFDHFFLQLIIENFVGAYSMWLTAIGHKLVSSMSDQCKALCMSIVRLIDIMV